jgi:hypothetical protein
MKQHAIFKDFSQTINKYLALAEQNIDIAVCWFTNVEIFETLKKKQTQGIKIRLIIEYDNQNFKIEGLDFQLLIQQGALLWGNKKAYLMHHKFTIIDEKILLTGSYNWTQNSNAENLIICEDGNLVKEYQQAFEEELKINTPLKQVRYDDLKRFSDFPLFQNTQHTCTYIRKRVSLGTKTWYIVHQKNAPDVNINFQTSMFSIDQEQILKPFWKYYRTWNELAFQEEMNNPESSLPSRKKKWFKHFLLKMKVGEYLLYFAKEGNLLGLGVIQSEPKMSENEQYSTYRNVQWIKINTDNDIKNQITLPKGKIGTYKGSVMHLLHLVME